MTRSAVREEYDALAGSYDRRWTGYNQASLKLLQPLLTSRPLGRVLDVGCGTGNLLTALGRWQAGFDSYVGADLSPAMLRVAAGKRQAAGAAHLPPVSLVAADATALPFAPGRFDTLVSASSLHYWPAPAAAMRQLRDLASPTGRLVLVDWCGDFRATRALGWWLARRGRPVEQIFTLAECVQLLVGSGFRPLYGVARKISTLWGLMVIEAVPGSQGPARNRRSREAGAGNGPAS